MCFQQKSLVTDRQKRTPYLWHVLLIETFPFYRRLKEIPKNHPPNCLIACINLSSPYHITAHFFQSPVPHTESLEIIRLNHRPPSITSFKLFTTYLLFFAGRGRHPTRPLGY